MLIRNWQSTPWVGPLPPGVPLAAWVGPHQHWDRWQRRALAAGISPELASLGREVMRQSTRQSWKRDLQLECGWEDEGEAMLELARQDSRKAEERWRMLLSTEVFEGGCGSPTGRGSSAC